jgi:hypothetical protein
MTDKEQVRKAIDLTLQAFAYDQLGPAGYDLAAGVRRDLGALTQGWPEAGRAQLAQVAAGVERDRHQFDRSRNHFIKDFRQRFGMDARRYAPEAKAQLDAAMADFNRRKLLVIDEAAARLFAEFAPQGRPA